MAESEIIIARQLNEKEYIDNLCLKNPPMTPIAEIIRLAIAKTNIGIDTLRLM